MVFLSVIFGNYTAVFFQVGISISQIIMDLLHICEHSRFNPWYFQVARNYHKLHHHIRNYEVGHGLTCRFWDTFFNTYPDGSESGTITWELHEKYPITKYISLPLPLIDFILITPFFKLSNNSAKNFPKLELDNYKISKLIIAVASGIIVGYSPFIIN